MKPLLAMTTLLLLAGCTTAPRTAENTDSQPTVWNLRGATYTDTNRDGKPDKWETKNTIYLDRNFDGRVDHEEDIGAEDYSVSKIDNDYDGDFDWRQTIGFGGSPVLHPIRERAPRFAPP